MFQTQKTLASSKDKWQSKSFKNTPSLCFKGKLHFGTELEVTP